VDSGTIPRIPAEAGGVVIAEDGPVVTVADRRIGPWATLAFVLARGNPFAGGIGDLDDVLSAAVRAR
jgi:hypothetical protein